jgi:hypothetical protein
MAFDHQVTEFPRNNFASFAIKTFNLVNPGQELRPTAAFLAITHKLAQVEAGKIKRLIINVPPRSAKSLLASIAFPAFVLGRNPSRRVICASYSGELAAKLARDCRNVMLSHAYRAFFPGTVVSGKNTETELETSKGGFRYSTSVGGTLTGRGGNFIIIDDPMKPDEAHSSVARDRVWEWFTGDGRLATRQQGRRRVRRRHAEAACRGPGGASARSRRLGALVHSGDRRNRADPHDWPGPDQHPQTRGRARPKP